jgi:hypothetical protein
VDLEGRNLNVSLEVREFGNDSPHWAGAGSKTSDRQKLNRQSTRWLVSSRAIDDGTIARSHFQCGAGDDALG